MPTDLPADLARCTPLDAAGLAALLASAIRVGRIGIGHFVLDTTTGTLYQKRTAGGLPGSLVAVGGGGAVAVPTGRIPYGNADGTGVTSDATLLFDGVTKTASATAFSASAFLQFFGATLFRMRLSGTPTADRTFTFPDVANDTVTMLAAAQSVTNKVFEGTGNFARNYGGASNAPVEMFGFLALGAGGGAAGQTGLAARVPFHAINDAISTVRSGAIESGWTSPTANSEQGYTAMCGAYAGTVYPVVRATVPPAAAAYTNGLNVQGSVMGSNPVLSPFGLGANLGLDFTAVGDGYHRFYGGGTGTVHIIGANASNNGTAEVLRLVHSTSVGIAATGMGVYEMLGVSDSAGLTTDLAGVVTTVSEATVGAIQGALELRAADGVTAQLGAGLKVEGEGVAAARPVGLWVIPGAARAILTSYGDANAFLDIRSRGSGYVSLTTPDGQRMVEIQPGPPRKLVLGNIATDVIAEYDGVGSAQLAHMTVASGTIEDVTAKFNLLRAYLLARGTMAAA